jgi:phage terminase small subunit
MSAPLNPRQQLFVDHYLIDLNGKEAAIRAGYRSSRAAARGYALLRLPEIRAAIADAMAARAQRTAITAERVLEEYARIAFADIRRFADWGPKGVRFAAARDLSPEDTPLIAELVDAGPQRGGLKRVKLFDKQAALTSLARILVHAPTARFGIALPPSGSPTAPAASAAQTTARQRRVAPSPRQRRFAASPRQRRFAEEYLTDFNAYAAARRAGYSERTAAMNMTKMKRHPATAALIASLIETRRVPIRAEADRVLQEYARIAFADIGRIADWDDKRLRLKTRQRLAPADSAAIANLGTARGITLELRLYDKVYALDMLAQHLGLLDPRMPGRTLSRKWPVTQTSAALRERLGRAR